MKTVQENISRLRGPWDLALIATSTLMIAACSGGGGGGPVPPPPQSLDNSRWLGECLPANSSSSTQVQVAFSGGRIGIRNYLYRGENCQTLNRPGRLNEGVYSELGPTDSGLYTKVNFTIPEGPSSHLPYTPLPEDIYVIEAGMLYFGDPNELVSGRPVLRKNLSNLTLADNNPAFVFGTNASANAPQSSAISGGDAVVTELEGVWRNGCRDGMETSLEMIASQIRIHKVSYTDNTCSAQQAIDSVEGSFTIGTAVLSANGLAIKPLSIVYDLLLDSQPALAADTHYYLDGATLYLGDGNGVDFDQPYYLEQ